MLNWVLRSGHLLDVGAFQAGMLWPEARGGLVCTAKFKRLDVAEKDQVVMGGGRL